MAKVYALRSKSQPTASTHRVDPPDRPAYIGRGCPALRCTSTHTRGLPRSRQRAGIATSTSTGPGQPPAARRFPTLAEQPPAQVGDTPTTPQHLDSTSRLRPAPKLAPGLARQTTTSHSNTPTTSRYCADSLNPPTRAGSPQLASSTNGITVTRHRLLQTPTTPTLVVSHGSVVLAGRTLAPVRNSCELRTVRFGHLIHFFHGGLGELYPEPHHPDRVRCSGRMCHGLQ